MYTALAGYSLAVTPPVSFVDLDKCNAMTSGEELSIMPVRFKSKEKTPEGDTLLYGSFPAQITKELVFLLYGELDCSFFKRDGDWNAKIDKKKFLDKYKDEYWLVYYLTIKGQNTERDVIYSAHQFKNIGAFGYAFSPDAYEGSKLVNDINFWKPLRVRPFDVLKIEQLQQAEQPDRVDQPDLKANSVFKIHWYSIRQVTEEQAKSRPEDTIILSDGSKVSNKARFVDKSWGLIIAWGIFIIDEDTNFYVVEQKLEGGFLPLIGAKKLKIRSKTTNREYFLNHYPRLVPGCFYNQESGKVYIISMPVLTDTTSPTSK